MDNPCKLSLRAEHESDLKIAVDKVKTEMMATMKQGSDKDMEEQLKAATDRGRMEVATKLKLKETLLSKTQNNLKQLEAKVQGWIEAGYIPGEGSDSNAKTPLAPVSVSGTAGSPASTSTSVPAAPVSVTSASNPPDLPRKPLPAAVNTATVTGKVADIATAVARGGVPVRGARGMTRGVSRGRGLGRGGAVATTVPATATTETPSTGMSIMGAATKRPREEAAESAPALAKRLKPIEGASGSASKPVALKRDRIPGLSPATGPSTDPPQAGPT